MTVDQLRASDPAVSAWVGASAGTGKTHVLTGRVLRLMISGTTPDKILGLTFTKAAAAEMSNRIQARLARWATMAEAGLVAELSELQGMPPEPDQMIRARKLFAQVLDVPGGLKIQTIHAFCQSLLGRFPIEAGQAPHFEVLDDRTAAEYLRSARDAILMEARAQARGPLARALARISERGTENTFTTLIGELIRERAHLGRLLGHFTTLPGLEVATRRALGLEASATVENLLAAACAEDAFDRPKLKFAADVLAEGTKTDVEKAEKVYAWLAAEPLDRPRCYDDYRSVFLTSEGSLRKTLATKGTINRAPAIADILQNEADRVLMISEQLKLLEIANNTLALLTITQGLLQSFDATKRRHAVLDYDDLILATSRLLTAPDAAPWVLYKLDGGIDHILIDEAQDTNPEQWQVVRALAGEFFAGDSARQRLRTMFAVGDVKQSIYSFQRADPMEFVRHREHFAGHAGPVEHPFRKVELSLSFRSTSAVLDLVDETFSTVAAKTGLSFDDETLIRHEAARKGHAGCVELWPTEIPEELDEPRNWTPPVSQEQSTAPAARLAVRIADRIAAWISEGEILQSRGRPIRPSDILVLVRRRNEFVHYLVRALKLRHVAVAGIDRMVLTDQLGVMDLMALAQFVLLPEDDLTLATVLKGPFVGWNDDDLFALVYNRGTRTVWSVLKERSSPKAEKACDWLKGLLAMADYAPPFEFFSGILERRVPVQDFTGRQALIARLGDDANDPVDEFLSLSIGFEQNHVPSLQGFLSWLAAGQAEVKRDMDQGRDEVRIMTIHGAKGLQAPIVFMPDTTQMPRNTVGLLWSDDQEQADFGAKNLSPRLMFWPSGAKNAAGLCADIITEQKQKSGEEQKRLLYVALTRAEDRLYITGWENTKGRASDCWYDLVGEAFDRLPGVEDIDVPDWGLVRRFQTAQTVAPAAKDEIDEGVRQAEHLPQWARNMAPDEPTPPRPLIPSRPLDEDPPVASPLRASENKRRDNLRFRRGRLIHRLLETLPDISPDQRAGAAMRYLSQSALGLDVSEVENIAAEVERVMSHPEMAALFGPSSRAEVPIAGLVGKAAMSGQVDRLAITADDVLVVDYKTNRPPPDDVRGTANAYVRQMAAYRRTLAAIYPDHNIRCALLWTDGPELMELPKDMLDSVLF